MLADPKKYIGRVAKVKAMKSFGDAGALFQPRFKEWHLDKGNIEKKAFLDELENIAGLTKEGNQKRLIQLVAAASALGTLPSIPFGKDRKSLQERIVAGAGEKAERKAAIDAESSFGSLAGTASFLGAMSVPRKLVKKIKETGKPIEEIAPALKKAIKVDVAHQPLDYMQGFAIPKGGILPKALRKHEIKIYENAGASREFIEKALKEGGVVAHGKSPEVLAHELGHLSLRKGKIPAALLKWGRPFGPMAGGLGGFLMSGSEILYGR